MKQTRRELFEACKRSNNIIKQIRARHGYSTRQWAKKLQLPHSTLRKVEITQSNLNPYKTMARLYQLLPYEEWLELVLSFSPIDCYLEVDRDELSPLGRADTI
jgi:transcriptional regulator with XRE-family HTH domain